ncbi:Integrase catalytic domain-containing protein [Citrus sinensis]|nr:Integrase catalytic domain-containing protein [Citrus sinensis]
MAGSKIDLEKFTGKNDFNMWKVKMEALLIIQGLGDGLELIIKKEGLEASTSSSSLTPQQATEIDKKARSTIILSLGDSVIREVARERTVADLWAKLEMVYMTKSLANRLYIKKRMFTLKMAEGSSLEDRIDEFNQVCDTLEIIDEGLADEGKALLLVSSLPSSYSNFVDALMYGRQTLSLDEVKAALNIRGLQEKSGNMNLGEVLVVKVRTDKYDGKKKKQGNNKQKTKGKKCFQCQKEGHFKRDCPDLKNKKKEQNEAAATVEEDGYESAGVCVATEHVQKDCGDRKCKPKLHDGTIRELREVRYVPDLKRNLISLGMLDQMGLSIKLESGELRISNGDGVVMKGYKRNRVYVLNGEAIIGVSGVSISSSCDNTLLWHLRLGHMSLRSLKELQKQGVLGSSQISELDFCEDCVLGKATRNSFGKSVHSTKGILEYIHSDLWGPAQTISLGGYFLSLIDDYSRRVWVYVLKHKDQVFGKFREWKSLVENQIRLKVKKLITDNGLEFCNQEFDNYCADHGIARHRLWAETLLTASYLVNLSPSVALDFKTPFEKWHGKPADYGILKVFGCPVYAHVSQGKLAPRALKGKFIGYPEASHQIDDDEPKNYKEAIQGPYKDEWKKAMDEEIYSLEKNNTWELVKRLANSRTRAGVDFKEVFSPVVRHTSIRVLLALTVVKDMELDQLDVKTAFLHGRLNEDILMTQPEGYTSPESADCVCLLKRSLYGLKQSPRQWYLRFDEFMVTHGYLSEREEIEVLKQLLNSEFDMKDLGPGKKILGMEIIRNMKKGTMILSQRKYLDKVLGVFEMSSSKFMVTPGNEHWKTVKWVLRYLKGTQEYGLVYGKSVGKVAGLCGYVDSDYAGDLNRRRSLTGYMFFLDGCLVNWKASLQHVVALSTTEAEYTAVTETAKEALWLRGLITKLGMKQEIVEVHCDSSSAIYLSKNPAHHEKTKHIDIKLQFIRNVISKGVISMVKVHTDDNPADMLTKVVTTARFKSCLDKAGLSDF